MNNQDTPTDAKEWSKFLAAQILPTGPFVGKQVLQTIKENELPYKKIAAQVNKDPVFSYHIMSKANQNKGDDASFSKTLDHAISMIGIDHLKKITVSLPSHKLKPNDVQLYYYARTICTSLLASYLARAFAALKPLGQTDDIYWGTLFCGVPMWYLWRFATPQMKQVRNAINNEKKPPKQAEEGVFGCTIATIAQQLTGHLNLPPLTKACYAPENQLTPRQWIKMSQHINPDGRPVKVDDKHINLTSSKATFAVTLANLLAHYASHDWYSSSTLRVQKVISVYLGIPLNKAITLTHECAVEMSREHPMPNLLLPATRLLLPAREKRQGQKPSAQNDTSNPSQTKPQTTHQKTRQDIEHTGTKIAEQGVIKPAEIVVKKKPIQSAPTLKESATHSSRGDIDVFKEFTDIMLKNPDNFVDLHELMNAATQCVAYGLGLQKAIVALVNTDETRLKSYYNVGTRDHPQLANYQANLTKPSLFSRLIEKPSGIWVKPTSNKNIWAMIPPEFKVASGAKEFFLMSIFVNKKPVAVFYADSGEESQPLTEYDYKQFKYMCSAATHCLQYLAAKRAKKA